jgi:acetolactate synthase-1/3 small subunit
LDQVIKQVNKFVNVLDVTEFSSGQATERELLILKVQSSSAKRAEIMQVCDIFRAKIIDVAVDSLNIEMTGNSNKVRAFLNLIEPYGIIEMARSGNIALKRG